MSGEDLSSQPNTEKTEHSHVEHAAPQSQLGPPALIEPSTSAHGCHRCRRRSNEVIIAHSEASVIVNWDGPDDKECPRNWPFVRKSLIVWSTSLLAFVAGFGSSVFAPSGPALLLELGASLPVSRLSVSLWVLAIPLCGPLSDIFGHQVALAISMLGLCLFQLPAALGTNIQTVLVSRTISGVFASGAALIVPRIYTDIYSPIPRSISLAVLTSAFHLGTTLSPIAAASLLVSPPPDRSPPWRWLSWLTFLLAAPLSTLTILFSIPETSTPLLLQRKARRLRLETGNWALHAQSEEAPFIQWRMLTQTYLSKPTRMLTTEPLLALFTLHLSIVHGVVYLILYAVPFAFQSRGLGWETPRAHLPLLAVALGGVAAGIATVIPFSGVFSLWRRGFGVEQTLESRVLPTMVLGSGVLPLGLFWFGWTTETHWFAQVIGAFFIGAGCVLVLASGTVYVLEAYGVHAESALVGHLAVRSLVAASFPLWVGPIYEGLGVGWASSVVAFGCLAMVPIPVVFLIWGGRMRERGRYGLTLE
ncbi:putative mfs multidrug transporter [Podospora aff. communis PSN243]|uniref:Mfs multidrug transporter n=1 Tax=Podospora aff. communis PSN243 TaxID=3040156 RepID=A0AAV9GHR4_9PEZI|nr:putative mfs multidrug transporter [Podospora aff. communis PSN243]